MPDQKIKKNIGKTARLLLSNCKLTGFISPVLASFVEIADRQNIVYLNSHRKKEIATTLRILESYIDVCIGRFIRQDYMVRVAESTYFINPFNIAKCSNGEILALQIRYEEARKIIKVNQKEPKKPKNDENQTKSQNLTLLQAPGKAI